MSILFDSFSYESFLMTSTWWVTGDKTGALDAPLILAVSIMLLCVLYGALRALLQALSAALSAVSHEKGAPPVKDIDVSFAWWDVACHAIHFTGATKVKTIFFANVLSALLSIGLCLRSLEGALPQEVYVRARAAGGTLRAPAAVIFTPVPPPPFRARRRAPFLK